MAGSELAIIGIIVLALYAYKNGILGGTTPPPAGGTPPPPGGTPPPTGGAGFVAAGDFEHTPEEATGLAASGKATVIGLGDYAYTGDANQWWTEDMAASNSVQTWYGDQGNHDGDEYSSLFQGNQGNWELTVQLGSVLIVIWNSESPDETFIDNACAQGEGDASVKLIVPCSHIPIRAPQGEHHPPENTGFHNTLLKYTKCKLVLNGHNHNYSRYVADGITYVCVGTGGKDAGSGYPVEADELTEVAFAGDMGYLDCTESGTGLSCNFVSLEGGGSDSFEIPF